MADKQKELDSYDVRGRHLIFTVESKKTCAAVIDAFKNGSPSPSAFKRISK